MIYYSINNNYVSRCCKKRSDTTNGKKENLILYSLKIYLKVIEKTRQREHATAALVVPTVNEKREKDEYSLLLTVHL